MIRLRDYQQQCIDAFYNYHREGAGGHGLIVVPTAGGKSIVIGKLAQEICQTWPGQRILILSHVRELIQQNHAKIMLCWPEAPAGIYSAALKKRQHYHPIVVASIQSVYKKAAILGHRDLLFIDEAHLIQSETSGMYRTLIAQLLEINPQMKMCGFTATDYRTDSGRMTDGENPLFKDIILEIPIMQLIEQGYLTPPIGKHSTAQADMEGVKITAGEFNIKQMGARFDQREFLNAALDSDMPFFEGRRSIALFCATLENAQHVAEGMTARGIYTEVVDGEMPQEERDEKFTRFRSGELRGLASVGVMTTGTDIPNIDCLVLLRAMMSPGLYQQIVGRGFRVVYAEGYDLETVEGRLAAIKNGGKPNFLVLDHGGNIMRHGAITQVEKPTYRKKGERRLAEKPKARICDVCRTANTLEAVNCVVCATELKIERDPTKALDVNASDADILSTPFTRGEVAQWFDVDDVRYFRHQKEGAPDSLRVTYYSGILTFDEWIHLERRGHLRDEAEKWWRVRCMTGHPAPANVHGAIMQKDMLKRPLSVMVRKNGKFFNVLNYKFNLPLIPEEMLHANTEAQRA